jgi:hypothetical protein
MHNFVMKTFLESADSKASKMEIFCKYKFWEKKKIDFHVKINAGKINWTRLLIVLSLKYEHNQNHAPKEVVSVFLKTFPILLRNLGGKVLIFNIKSL